MSHYKPYPAYKDSGVECLGSLPVHWHVKQLKYLTSHIGSGKTPSGGAEVYQDAGILFLRSQNIYEDGLRLDDATFISNEIDSEMQGSRVKPYDVLLNITGASIGRSCLVPGAFDRANVNQHVCIVRAENPILSNWISLCIPSNTVQTQIDYSQNGAGREGLNFEQIGNMSIALPSDSEINAISRHLDRETARIDALVTKKIRFIELLREKRQALITHAVTKGLDPTVKMKDSGEEWLGEIPEHWELMPLKRDLHFLTSGSRGWAEHYSEDGALFLRIGNLTRRSLDLDLSDIQRVSVPEGAEGERTKVSHGDILFSITAYLGSVAVVPADLETAYVSQHIALARLARRTLAPEWVGYVAMSWLGKAYLESQGYGGTKIQLSLDDIANMLMTAPPLAEQDAILRHIIKETARIDNIILKTEGSLTLLKERRSALITAAVTGQIDLREAV